MLPCLPRKVCVTVHMGVRILLFSFYEIFSFPLKISLTILHPFKAIPTQKAALYLGQLTYAKGLRDDGHVKAISCHEVGVLLGCGTCPGMSL